AEMDPSAQGYRLIPTDNSNDESLLIEVVDENGTVLASSSGNNVSAWMDHKHILDPLTAARQSGVRVHEMPEDSPRPSHLVAYAPLASVPQWGVTVEQDQDVALALPYNLQSRIFILGAVVLLLGSVLAWTDVRRVVQPLGMLTTASTRMAAGDLETPITTTRGDELGELARTFELMRVKLRDSLEEIGQWNQELEQRVNQRTQELSALFEASQTLALAFGLMQNQRETYSQLTAKIARVVGAGNCLIALLRGEGEVVGQAPGYGIEEDRIQGFRYRSGALQSPSIVAPGIVPIGDSSHGRTFLHHFGGDAALAVPLKVEGKTIGIIFAGEKAGGFSEHDARLLTIVAGQAAVAVENARLYSELQRKEEMRRQLLDKVILAQEEERKRISRELHDDVGQALTALVMNLGGIEESLPSKQGGLRGNLATIRDLASETLAAIRRLMLDLRPTLLDDLGLIPAISWYAENNLGRAHIRSQVEVVGFQGRRLPVQMETVLFRVIQEAITNIVKHSSATEAVIRLELVDGKVRAIMSDNGKGFEVGDKVHGYDSGLGLMGMQERVSLLGGSLRIDSQPGRGTSLSLEIPLGELVK
ncbi:MAG: histidine kinase, partial [Dehalococcoidia bacterium]|nr:histidine kinase [Dehalococcoidia bacterium]